MERGSKRKAAMAIAASPDGRASKRQRTPDVQRRSATGETPDSTMEAGLKFIEALRAATDNRGRQYTGAFLTLPNRNELPDYYEQIKMPLAIDDIEAKLHRKEYLTLTELESDMKRLVSNAKNYNEKTSDIFADAERIRKMLGNYMKKINPAYKDPSYVATATPLPDHLENENAHNNSMLNGTKSTPDGQTPEVSMEQAPDEEEVNQNAPNFKGKSFQEAQDLIISELISYKEGDLRIYEPFLNLPPRSLTDYYAIIKQPTCLKGVQKKVRGVHGRAESTGSTDLKSWGSFQNEAKKIWQNAREYNEDGSDMFNLAGELEELLKAAKKSVKEPVQTTLKLNLTTAPTSIKLRLGPQKTTSPVQPGSPAPSSAPTPAPAPAPAPAPDPAPTPTTAPASAPTLAQTANGTSYSVDEAALERQRLLVQAGSNGVPQSRPGSSHSSSRTATTTGQAAPLGQTKSGQALSPTLSADIVKREGQTTQPMPMTNGIGHTIHPSNYIPPTAMPPPQRPASGSPHPTIPQQSAMYITPHVPHAQPDLSKWRTRGADASNALFNPLTIGTPPTLPISTPFNYVLPADAHLAAQSITLNLPATHHTLLVTPTIRPDIFASGLYRLFVTANGLRVMGGPTGGPGSDPSKPVHEVRLLPGINRIEIEMVAEPLRKRESDSAEKDRSAYSGTKTLDIEKVSIFVQVMKA